MESLSPLILVTFAAVALAWLTLIAVAVELHALRRDVDRLVQALAEGSAPRAPRPSEPPPSVTPPAPSPPAPPLTLELLPKRIAVLELPPHLDGALSAYPITEPITLPLPALVQDDLDEDTWDLSKLPA